MDTQLRNLVIFGFLITFGAIFWVYRITESISSSNPSAIISTNLSQIAFSALNTNVIGSITPGFCYSKTSPSDSTTEWYINFSALTTTSLQPLTGITITPGNSFNYSNVKSVLYSGASVAPVVQGSSQSSTNLPSQYTIYGLCAQPISTSTGSFVLYFTPNATAVKHQITVWFKTSP